ncbi:MAG: hypothetical protein J6J36_01650 [Clostridia bacterium]|nr:hypothetical protein [Clostridia bacterium]
MALIKCGKFPEDNTPYSKSWGKTFDYITGSCLNIAYGYMLLQQHTNGDEDASKIDLGGLSEELDELDVNIPADDGDNASEIDDHYDDGYNASEIDDHYDDGYNASEIDDDDDDDYYCRRRGVSNDCCDVYDCCYDIYDC